MSRVGDRVYAVGYEQDGKFSEIRAGEVVEKIKHYKLDEGDPKELLAIVVKFDSGSTAAYGEDYIFSSFDEAYETMKARFKSQNILSK